jgi:hypothetical protein
MMIFKRGFGRIEDKKRDAHTVISAGKAISSKGRFIHCDYKDIESLITKYNTYAIREMQDYLEFKKTGATRNIITDKSIQNRRRMKYDLYYRAPRFVRCHLWFIYNYYFKFGFLDGKEGYIFHYFECYWYRFLVDVQLYEHDKMKAG